MSKTTFTIQNKSLAQIIFVTVLLIPFGLVVGISANNFISSEKVMFVGISLSILYFLVWFLMNKTTTIISHIIVDDHILSIEEKTSRGKHKYYTVNLNDIDKIYYLANSRKHDVISLKIKLVDRNNQTKLQIRTSNFESDTGMGKENIKNLVAFSNLIFDKLNIDIKSKGKYHIMSNVREYSVRRTHYIE